MSDVQPSGDAYEHEDSVDASQDERISILTVAQTWWAWCLGLIFVLTIVWTALVAQTVVASGEYKGAAQTIVAIVSTSAPGEFLIIIYSLMTVTALDLGGGYIVVTARYLTNKWVKPLQDKFRQEGHEEGRKKGLEEGIEIGVERGRAEGREMGATGERQYWLDRERRRLEAEAQGIPFDEPLPDDEPHSTNGTASKDRRVDP